MESFILKHGHELRQVHIAPDWNVGGRRRFESLVRFVHNGRVYSRLRSWWTHQIMEAAACVTSTARSDVVALTYSGPWAKTESRQAATRAIWSSSCSSQTDSSCSFRRHAAHFACETSSYAARCGATGSSTT